MAEVGKLMETEKWLDKWAEQPVSYMQRDLLLYAIGIGCTELDFVYEHAANFAAFPTYSFVLPFKGTSQEVVSFPSEAMMKGAKFPPLSGVKVGLDGERFIEVVNPLPTEGAQLRLKARVTGVFKRGSGATVEYETLLVDDSGKEYSRILGTSFLVGAKGFKDSGTPILGKDTVSLPSRAPDAIEEMTTLPYQTHIYRLSGDYNPLHIDPESAKKGGFQEPILHGLCSLGHSARAVLKRFGNNDPKAFKTLKLRFAKPVMPGQTLVVEMWQDGNKVYFQTKVKETGQVVVNNAYVEFHAQSKL